MQYRREIDGLRALAVIPVILFHARLLGFSGGYVGVDVFFVISGYLITRIILQDLAAGRFSLADFYERRTRRIFPALAVVMLASLVAGYLALMPDEFKNLGQSFVATSLFSNNILLAITTGYWDLSGEFKPLLHTWSLGVEEQYYLAAPLFLMVAWRFRRQLIPALLLSVALASFAVAIWLAHRSPDWAFYSLPSRAWEIALGGLVAVHFQRQLPFAGSIAAHNAISLAGFGLILAAIAGYGQDAVSPGLHTLIPTVGAALVIVFAREGTLVHRLLASQPMVAVGLVSYSLYLWHQPIFAYMRAFSTSEPGVLAHAVAILLTSVLAAATYRWVERPFRDRSVVPRGRLFALFGLVTLFYIGSGSYLNATYGMPERVKDPSFVAADMDKRLYNRRAFAQKRDAFGEDARLKLLIIGNSYGRDFTNLTLETFDTRGVEIVYRDDLEQGILPYRTAVSQALFSRADVIVFASGFADPEKLDGDLRFARERGKSLYYVGKKNFGYNLNWLIAVDPAERANRYNPVPIPLLAAEEELARLVPAAHFIPLLAPVLSEGRIPVTDDKGRLLSTDRAHLTKYGAIYFGEKSVRGSRYADHFPRR